MSLGQGRRQGDHIGAGSQRGVLKYVQKRGPASEGCGRPLMGQGRGAGQQRELRLKV